MFKLEVSFGSDFPDERKLYRWETVACQLQNFPVGQISNEKTVRFKTKSWNKEPARSKKYQKEAAYILYITMSYSNSA